MDIGKFEIRIQEFQSHIETLNTTKKEYRKLISQLKTLPDTLTQKTKVPLGKYAFFEGEMVDTNEVLILLGENYFAQRSAKQTIDIIQRREKDINANIKNLTTQIDALRGKMEVATDISKALRQNRDDNIIEIKEEYDSDEEKKKVKSKKTTSTTSTTNVEQKQPLPPIKRDKEEEEELNAMFSRLLELEKKEKQAEEQGFDLDGENDDDDDDEEGEEIVEYYDEDGNRIDVGPDDDVEYIQEKEDESDGAEQYDDDDGEYGGGRKFTDHGDRYQDDEEYPDGEDDNEEINEEIERELKEQKDNSQEISEISDYLKEKRVKYQHLLDLKHHQQETSTTSTTQTTTIPKSILKQKKEKKPIDRNSPIDFIKNKQVSFQDIKNDVSKPNPPTQTVFGEIVEKDSDLFELPPTNQNTQHVEETAPQPRVRKNDNPLYELEFPSSSQKVVKDQSYMQQYILHSSLDIVEEVVWKSTNMYLKIIDKHNKYNISSYVTSGHIKFMLLHEKKDEEAIKNFFGEVHDLYIKILLNPFYTYNTPITSTVFDARVRKLGAKYFF
ncbi:RNA polymerase II subunit 5-mediating protein [Cavenderia fasciculata]|uniref:RNA polymerase II subunit 5-mediating protein n=1 Tax=Cavenderia fasciculata TaxID=261658 RepID=F4Q487_CACFS|nr:RNA polymerase II subunit 5-mediating protein [Cavenderia fasciculata]EGG17789.1 RNA polymerase II subunit 5-mediating protein [Cavenderia fasciculata]|eukprot:XP_004356273.1 RNA polymerase II subunit 5-mediating protein [Cavenderia fasciculata]